MTEAIFGLVGVLVGGLLSGGLGYIEEKRSSKAAAKVSARLVLSEIEGNQTSTRTVIKSERLGAIGSVMSGEAWRSHAGTFAAILSDTDWSAMNAYYIATARHLYLIEVAGEEEPVSERDRFAFERLLARGEKATAIALHHAGKIVPHNKLP